MGRWICCGRAGRCSRREDSPSDLRLGRRYRPPGSSSMAWRFLSFAKILNSGRVSAFFRCRPWAISLVEAGSLLICRKRKMLSGLRCEGRGMGYRARAQVLFSHRDSSHFFWFFRNFFPRFRDYIDRPTHDRPFALRQEWPGSPRGENKGGGKTWPASFFHLVLSLDTNDLAQGMDNLHQIALRRHDGFDGLVGRRGLVDNVGVFTTFDTFG